jgi:hypothetical protein
MKEKLDARKVVKIGEHKIELASGKELTKAKAAVEVKTGERKLFVKTPGNVLTASKDAFGHKYVRAIADKTEGNNLLELPRIEGEIIKPKKTKISRKVVKVSGKKIELASGEVISKAQAAKDIKTGKRKLYVKKPSNKLTPSKNAEGIHHVRVVGDKSKGNNLLKLPTISEAKLKTKRHSLKVVRVNDNKIQLA